MYKYHLSVYNTKQKSNKQDYGFCVSTLFISLFLFLHLPFFLFSWRGISEKRKGKEEVFFFFVFLVSAWQLILSHSMLCSLVV